MQKLDRLAEKEREEKSYNRWKIGICSTIIAITAAAIAIGVKVEDVEEQEKRTRKQALECLKGYKSDLNLKSVFQVLLMDPRACKALENQEQTGRRRSQMLYYMLSRDKVSEEEFVECIVGGIEKVLIKEISSEELKALRNDGAELSDKVSTIIPSAGENSFDSCFPENISKGGRGNLQRWFDDQIMNKLEERGWDTKKLKKELDERGITVLDMIVIYQLLY